MKIRNIFLATAFIFAVACVKENPVQEDGGKTDVDVTLVPMEFTTEIETKTSLQGGTDVHWISGDKICIFTEDNTNSSFETSSEGESAVFTGTAPVSSYYYALYPYRSGAKFDNSTEQIATTLFADQKAKVGSFADDVAIMVAKADANKLSFKNVCSHVKFTLPADFTEVKSMTLMGNKSEVLCGTFSIAWNGGDPTITMTSSETYVTLRNEDGTALTPGEDYYFTVLPVTFEDGFTVILSLTDGSQKAITTTKTFDFISSRNKILVMNTPAAEKFTDHMNYFVKYNDGFSLDFGGVAINKEAYPGGVLVNDTKGNTDLSVSAEGIYFVDPLTTGAQSKGVAAYKTLIIIGSDASNRSKFTFTKQIRPYEGGKIILLANMDCIVGEKNAIAQNTGTDGHCFASFGDLVLSNCHFRNIGQSLIRFNYNSSAETAIKSLNVCIENSEFGIKPKSSGTTYESVQLFVCNKTFKSIVNKFVIKNNIFYAEDDNVSGFQFINGYSTNTDKLGLSITDLVVCNNTCVGTYGTYYIRLSELATCDTQYNLFVETAKSGSNGNLVTVQLSETATGSLKFNYYYSSEGAVNKGTVPSGVSSGSPVALSSTPLSSSWKPEDGTFGAYSFEVSSGTAPSPSVVGAQRADMSATPGTASYRYPSVDLGTF